MQDKTKTLNKSTDSVQQNLQTLQEALVHTMLTELEQYKEEGIPVPAADKQAIIALLKHNDIVASPIDEGKLEELQAKLKSDREARKSNMRERLKEAQSNILDLDEYSQFKSKA